MKAIIIGGGIGGLTAAIALHKVGLEAHVHERAPRLCEIGAVSRFGRMRSMLWRHWVWGMPRTQ
jgi:2-polyprenyl-6-methoxyphenol hydroxylase-like FAD-dependent oxidoreductase